MNSMKLIAVTFALLTIPLLSFCQKEGNIWYFGIHGGLDFNSGSPVALTDGKTFTREGVTSIADKTTGQILFYTTGDTIWDRTHNPMPNGTGLWGNKSTTQAAVIVPAPGSDTLYYVFTVDAAAGKPGYGTGYGGVSYSIVDITLNNGKGDVTVKNQPLLTPTAEKICVTKHANGSDRWVLVHQWGTDAFYAYQVSASGIQPPVISHAGIIHQDIPGGWSINYESLGCMKFSPDSKKLAVVISSDINVLQLFDFDNATGTVSNSISNSFNGNSLEGPYGVSFSPDNSKLYVGYISLSSSPSRVYQYDLSSGDSATIAASKTIINSQFDKGIGSLQIGPDGKIYVAKSDFSTMSSGSDYIDVINCPNAAGSACGYTVNAVFLGGAGKNQSTLGLPNIMDDVIHYKTDSVTLTYNSGCAGNQQLSFAYTSSGGNISYTWNFGDAASGTNNSSTLANPSHTFSGNGNYRVKLSVITTCKTDTFSRTVTVQNDSSVSAGEITIVRDTICAGTPGSLTVTQNTLPVIWQSSPDGINFADEAGATGSTFISILSKTTYFRVLAGVGGCSDTSDVKKIIVRPSPVADFTFSSSGLQFSFNSAGSSGDVTIYDWDFGDGGNSGDENPSHTFPDDSTYHVCLTVYNGSNCSYTVCKDISTGTSGAAVTAERKKFKIFQNPGSNSIQFISTSESKGVIELFDLPGRTVFSTTYLPNQPVRINTAALSPGVYLLRIINGKNTLVEKIPVQ